MTEPLPLLRAALPSRHFSSLREDTIVTIMSEDNQLEKEQVKNEFDNNNNDNNNDSNNDIDNVMSSAESNKEFEEVMDSMCMECGGTGTTRYMIHKIPYFRELVISSFECHDEDCGERNNSVSFGGEIQLQGCAYTLEVQNQKDLDRQLIKSDSASVIIPR